MKEAIFEQVYAFLEDYIRRVGCSPIYREIAIGCHMTLDRTMDALSILEARGKIEREEGVHRSIRIVSSVAD